MKAENRWWLVDPNGYLFLSAGVDGVSLAAGSEEDADGGYREAALEKHQSESAWAEATASRLREWGFNTLGPDSDEAVRDQEMAFTVNLECSRPARPADVGLFPDVFDPDFERGVRRYVARACRAHADDRRLVGYFTDGRLDWGRGNEGTGPLMARFLSMEDAGPGRRGVLDFLERRYLTIAELDEAWATSYESFEEIGRTPQVGSRIPQADIDGFQQVVAREYFRITHEAIRENDRHHLILGPRFEGEAPGPVLAAMGDLISAVSVEWSAGEPSPAQLRRMQGLADKPVLICDFAVAVSPVASGARRRVRACAETEEEQAAQVGARVREFLALPTVIGYHWQSYVDETAGRGRGRCGLVGRDDEAHEALAAAAAETNGALYELAAVRAKGQAGRKAADE
jgi:agarase